MAKVMRLINGVLRAVTCDGEVSIGSGVASVAVTFPATLQTANATPKVIAWMINTTDTTPQFQPVECTARSATGFTATWNGLTDTANYKLVYVVVDGWII